jgi:hypothetical protein
MSVTEDLDPNAKHEADGAKPGGHTDVVGHREDRNQNQRQKEDRDGLADDGLTRHKLIGSQVRESSRSEAINEANPARLTDTPATAVKKNWPSILPQSYRRVRIDSGTWNNL